MMCDLERRSLRGKLTPRKLGHDCHVIPTCSFLHVHWWSRARPRASVTSLRKQCVCVSVCVDKTCDRMCFFLPQVCLLHKERSTSGFSPVKCVCSVGSSSSLDWPHNKTTHLRPSGLFVDSCHLFYVFTGILQNVISAIISGHVTYFIHHVWTNFRRRPADLISLSVRFDV